MLNLCFSLDMWDNNELRENPEQVQIQFRIKTNSPQMELVLNRSTYGSTYVIIAVMCSVINGLIKRGWTIITVLTADSILPLLST